MRFYILLVPGPGFQVELETRFVATRLSQAPLGNRALMS